jgi:hypothetical protein
VCGHSCLAGACSGSTCQPWVVAQLTDGAIFYPRSFIATDGVNVVWLDQQQGVLQAPIAGGTPIALTGVGTTSGTFAGLALANGLVAWTTSTPAIQVAVEGVARSQSTAQLLASGTPQGLALDPTAAIAYLDIQTATAANIDSCTLGSNVNCFSLSPWALSPASGSGNDVAANAKYIFATDSANGTVSRAPVGNLSFSPIATGQDAPFRLALDATHVYWASAAGTQANPTYTVRRTVQDNPSTPDVIDTGYGTIIDIATDGKYIYYVSTIGRVQYAPVDQSLRPQPLPAPGQTSLSVYAVAAGGGAVLWFDGSNPTIYGVASP